MRKRFLGVAVIAALALAACGDSGSVTTTAPGSSTAATVLPTAPSSGDATPANPRLSAGFVGDVGAGLTEAELRTGLGSGYEVVSAGTVLADTVGFTVLKGGIVQFHALHRVGAGPELDLLVTDNPAYRTAEGIGPGTTIDEAVTVYGPATISYSSLGETRELVVFAAGPDDSIVFRAFGPSLGELAGVYGDASDGFAESTEYQPGSTIGQIWIFEVEEPVTDGLDTFDVQIGTFAVQVSEGSSLNIRSGPGTEFDILDAFGFGSEARTTGVGALDSEGAEWWEVELPGSAGTGWVSQTFLDTS